ncbi:MAG: hypothetical protein ISP49_06110 [Reyranella sp.]|nr:hypothetical protein [Reyranella sp.]MBL6651145.1 hypothetical protein [Reyranella sp.]
MAQRKTSGRKSPARKTAPRRHKPAKKPKPRKLVIPDGAPDPRDPRVNPYVAWACGPGKALYFPSGLQDGPDKRLTLLMQVKGSALDFAKGDTVLKKRDPLRKDWEDTTFIAPFAGVTAEDEDAGSDWLLALAPPTVMTRMVSGDEVLSVVLGRPLNTASLPLVIPGMPAGGLAGLAPQVAALPPPSGTQARVFVGVIDDGIAFANERFRVKSSSGQHLSRVQGWWAMATGGGGKSLIQPAIDTLFAACTNGNGVLEEDDVYRRAGLIDFCNDEYHKAAAWRISHGTHVMDAACGYAVADNRVDRPVACVQLPIEVTADVDNGQLSPFLLPAVAFIVLQMLLYCLTKGHGPLPVVINFSYGRLEGPHDGSGDVEALIQDMVYKAGFLGITLRFVLPSGNSFLSRTHAQMTFDADHPTHAFDWQVLPNDQTESFVEVWTPPYVGSNSRLQLTVTDPLGDSFTIDENDTAVPLGNSYPGWLVHRNYNTKSAFYIFLPPTETLTTASICPCGYYRISLTHTGGLAATDYIDAWVARDDSVPGYPQFGRQSYLGDRTYRIHSPYSGRRLQVDNDSLVQRQCSLNAIACGADPIVIGGILRKEMVMAEYSSAGARQPRPRPPRWPDASAPSEDSLVLEGRLAAGSHSGARVPIGGTSVAAPQVARMVADDLAAGGLGDNAYVQSLAEQAPSEPPPPPAVAKPPDERSGAGRIWGTPLQKVKRYEY